MDAQTYFKNPLSNRHKQYLALREHYTSKLSIRKAASKYGISKSYLKKTITETNKLLQEGKDPFFQNKSKGPRERSTSKSIQKMIIQLRKQNHSVLDIKTVLDAGDHKISLDTIDNILKEEGFARLPRRTHGERHQLQMPNITPQKTSKIELDDEKFSTGKSGGILVFLPLLEELGIVSAIKKAQFPGTNQISATSYVLSFLALKLLGNKRLSHDESWAHDRALGLFAGLNVLPKSSSLSSYSYRVSRESNYKFLVELNKIFHSDVNEEGEFNLDFKTIPHWGNESVLEKNYSTMRGKSVKSILALIVQNANSEYLSYTNAEVKHSNQGDAVIEFVDFWKESKNENPKMLIFDCQFTIYQNLRKLEDDGIKFITLRKKRSKMLEYAAKLPIDKWQHIEVVGEKKKTRKVKVYEETISLPGYGKDIRQIIFYGRMDQPIYMITNEFDMPLDEVIRKYGRRWLVEQEIAAQINFFHLNQLSSSLVVKVDFDLTMSLLADNLYRKLASRLERFEQCRAHTINRRFVENRADVNIEQHNIKVNLGKRTHNPTLFKMPELNQKTYLSWMNCTIEYATGTSS